jgi:hypothetical protein
MRVLFILLLISFSIGAIGQADKLLYAKKVEKYRKMRNVGVVMLVSGVVAAGVGISKISNSTSTQVNGVYTYDPQTTVGAVLFIGGGCLAGAGVPLSIVGAVKTRKYQEKLNAVSLSVNVAPHCQQYGLTLRYTFAGN